MDLVEVKLQWLQTDRYMAVLSVNGPKMIAATKGGRAGWLQTLIHIKVASCADMKNKMYDE